MKYKAIFFDLGDTLMYFDGDWPEVFLQARIELLCSLQEAGINLGSKFVEDFYQSMTEYYRAREIDYVETTVKEILRIVLEEYGLRTISDEILTSSLADMHLVTQAHWIPEPEALPVLTQLKGEGYRMALISNGADDANTQVLVDKLGARDLFEIVISSAAIGIRKPNPRIFIEVLRQMKLNSKEVVMVGDTLSADVLGAQKSGIFSIWIKKRGDTHRNRIDSKIIFPDRQIDNLSELPDLLMNLRMD
jgi:HAD superfamily hydrolase (TIGR01509 family)